MLKERVVSALLLVSLIVWGLFTWSHYAFATLLGVFILVGAWEWTRLMGMVRLAERIAYVVALALVGAWIITHPSWVRPLVFLAVLFWVLVLAEQVLLKRIESGLLVTYAGKLLGGFLILLPAWIVPLALQRMPQGAMPEGRWLVLYLMLLVWTADTG
ncbi:MAG: phosphatidate cytidylyltransferase, partial [Gammaproteobacteria bacterium]|nr:phosphatidate cytidylyltransferase [Gammaproteobacteria bacterium]